MIWIRGPVIKNEKAGVKKGEASALARTHVLPQKRPTTVSKETY